MLANNAVIGGEGNGGVIDPRIVPGRDSLVGMAYVLQLMAATGKTICQLVAEIPRYEIVKTKFECRREDADRAVEAVKKEFANEKVDTQDGIRIDWPNALGPRPAEQHRADHADHRRSARRENPPTNTSPRAGDRGCWRDRYPESARLAGHGSRGLPPIRQFRP